MKRIAFVFMALFMVLGANAQKNTIPIVKYDIKDCMKERFSLEKVARMNKYVPPTSRGSVLYSIDYYDEMSSRTITIFVQPNVWHKILGFLDAKAEMNKQEDSHPWWQELNSLVLYKLNGDCCFIDFSK